MAMQWTDDQLKVITSRNRNLLVSAAAGSGKTAVLVERIIRMITDKDRPLDIDRLLIVTFTNAAASEMRERIGQAVSRLLEEEPHNIHLRRQSTLVHHAKITTVHSFCLNLIREHFNQLDIDPAFRIGDEGELLLLQADVMKQLLEECYELGNDAFENFVETYSSGKTDYGIDEYIFQVYRFAMSNPWPQLWLEECRKELGQVSREAMKDMPWMKYLMKDVSVQLKELGEQLAAAAGVCQEENGPAAYLPMLLNDIAMLDGLHSAKDYEALNEALKTLKFDRLAAVRGKDIDPEKKAFASSVRDRVKKAAGKLRDLYCFENTEAILHDIEGSREPVLTLLSLTEAFAVRYQEKKREKNIVDFNDLEHYALQILVNRAEDGTFTPSKAADQMSRQYEEILIDEYQDSNYVQETLMNSISKERFGQPNIFMVGDVKQSIYRFRLARPELFMEKYETYSTEDGAYQKIELHQNFRSRESVLSSINEVFYRIMAKSLGNIDYTKEAALHPGAVFAKADGPAGTPTEFLAVNTSKELLKQLDEENADYTSKEIEARLIVKRIRELTDTKTGLLIWDKELEAYRTARPGDMVILLRSLSGWGEVFTNVLMNEGISAYAESKAGYFNTIEVETVLSMLAVIDNPIQDIPLAAVLKSPFGQVTDQELAGMLAVFKKRTIKSGDKGVYGAWNYYLSLERSDELAKKLTAFRFLWEDLSRKSRYLNIHELLYELFGQTGYYRYVSVMPAGETRKANLDMLVEKALSYEATSYHGLFHFIRYIERLKKYNTDFGEANAAGNQKDTVRIMSIHKSKGLEFPIVFLAGMGKNFNKQDAYSKILIDPELGIGADYLDLENRLKTTTLKKNVLKRRTELEGLGEELRVLYVGMTRAKEKLIMTGTDRSLDKKLEKWKGQEGAGRLPFTVVSAAGSYLDWIIMSRRRDSGLIQIEEVPVEALVGEETVRQALSGWQKEDVLNLLWNSEKDEAYMGMLEHFLDFSYPFENEISLHTKVSVSELKRLGQLIDEEESDFLPTIPQFMRSGMEEAGEELLPGYGRGGAGGAYRGVAYHRVMELLDFTKVLSEKDVEQATLALVKEKRLTEEGRCLVSSAAVWKLLDSELGRRMSLAQKEGRLYRERQFMIGIPAREMEKGDSDELVLVQGIIDAYFEEGDILVLADYKTDRLNEGQEDILVKRYKTQLDYYQKALEQMTGKRVGERIIYSLALQKEIRI